MFMNPSIKISKTEDNWWSCTNGVSQADGSILFRIFALSENVGSISTFSIREGFLFNKKNNLFLLFSFIKNEKTRKKNNFFNVLRIHTF